MNTEPPHKRGGKQLWDMITIAEKKEENMNMKQLQDIAVDISWLGIARRYFGKSASWFYHKLNGIDGNGKPTKFTEEETEQLKGALVDLANRIRQAADRL